jgi:hypothetical protein
MQLATDRRAKTITGPMRKGSREIPFLRKWMKAGEEFGSYQEAGWSIEVREGWRG